MTTDQPPDDGLPTKQQQMLRFAMFVAMTALFVAIWNMIMLVYVVSV